MGLYTELENGAQVKCYGLMANALRAMWDSHWWQHRPSENQPFHKVDSEWYIKPYFYLTHADMVHVTTLMFQKLFPTSSWRRTWKRKTGHQQWITTQQMVMLVLADRRYQALTQALEGGRVSTIHIAQFAYFERLLQRDDYLVTGHEVRQWVEWVFLTSELMRELDCRDARSSTRYFFS
jgi:hypothetical protein